MQGLRAGLTRLEVLCILVVLIAILAVALPILWSSRRDARQVHCSTQLQAIGQALVMSSVSNTTFLRPSQADSGNMTVPEIGLAKDHTASIFSLLIFFGYITPEICVTPAESALDRIEVDRDYWITNPPTAVNPINAVWDPAFNADFTRTDRKGNVSYAHILPVGPRLNQWADTFAATEALLANRGPLITSANPLTVDSRSNTFLIHSDRNAWEGNVVYADGHVDFERGYFRHVRRYAISRDRIGNPERTAADILFFDEPDDAIGKNAYLSIFRRAGETMSDFDAIWD